MNLKNIKDYVKLLEEKCKKTPLHFKKIALLLIGENAQNDYRAKLICGKAQEVRVKVDVYFYAADITEFELELEIAHLEEFYDGIGIMGTLPAHIRMEVVNKAIPVEKDVLGIVRDGRARAIMNYLDYCGYDLKGKNVVVICDYNCGSLLDALIEAQAAVTFCRPFVNVSKYIYDCDFLIVEVNKLKFLNCYSIHVPVVDMGLNFDGDKLLGDTFNVEDRNVNAPGDIELLAFYEIINNIKEGV